MLNYVSLIFLEFIIFFIRVMLQSQTILQHFYKILT